MILFFDTFIVSRHKNTRTGSGDDKRREAILNAFMSRSYTYRYQSKIDIVKYTLASYAIINWDKVIIRFECEDIEDVDDFQSYCHNLFPEAAIINSRSDTAQKYVMALDSLKIYGNPWIFFSPNNDHPFINQPERFNSLINLAEECERKYPDAIVSVLYSHFTESQNDLTPKHPQWGYWAGCFKRLLETYDFAYVVTSNVSSIDSIKIYRLNFLISIFSNTKNKGRVIRIEDTEFYLSKIKEVSVIPRKELCRHYDSYCHVTEFVPPLFIPDGFFTNEIKIRYGYNEWKKGYVNINPLHNEYGSDESCSDLLCLLKDIPYFWKNRIKSIDIYVNFHEENLFLENLYYHKVLLNPWYQNSATKNVLLSLKRFLSSKLHYGIIFILKKFLRPATERH